MSLHMSRLRKLVRALLPINNKKKILDGSKWKFSP